MNNIDAVKEKIDIVELVNSYVPLKRSGRNYKGLCPFHNEKTPSFMVSPELQIFKCFGCGKGGDIFKFIMEIEGVDFPEALKILADKAGVTLTYDSSEKSQKEKSQKQKIIEINTLAAKYFNLLLEKHKYGAKAKKYLQKRNISEDSIKEFQLGYAPNSWSALSSFLQKKGFTKDEIVLAGLAKYKRNKSDIYDTFRARLMFPLKDHLDRVVGFSGRALLKDQEPKYINSPETPVFHKDQFLYGLNLAKTHIKQEGNVIIVEGQFDMISPYQKGVKNIVASMGTALTPKQAGLIKRYTDTVILMLDSDTAGITAALRGIESIKQHELNIFVVTLPKKYKDPDELAQESISKLKDLIVDAMPIWDFYFKYAFEMYNFDDIYQRQKASTFLLQKINQIDDSVVKSEYIKKFAEAFDVDEQTAISQLEKVKNEPKYKYLQKVIKDDTENKIDAIIKDSGLKNINVSEVYLIALLLELKPTELSLIVDQIKPEYFTSNELRQLYEVLKASITDEENLDIKEFYGKLQDNYPEIHSVFENIYLSDVGELRLSSPSSQSNNLDSSSFDDINDEIVSTINRLKLNFHKRKLKEISKAMKKAEAISDKETLKNLQKQAQYHTKEMSNLTNN